MKLRLPSYLAFSAVLLLCPAAPAQTTDPVKVAQLQDRFKAGLQLVNEEKFEEALKVFKGIIKDEPKARGSLFYSGLVDLQLGDPESAEKDLEGFRELEPNDFRGIVLLIQADQALRKTVKVEALRKQLYSIRNASNVPGLTDTLSYIRERINEGNGGKIRINEFFDYKADPNYVYMAQEINPKGEVSRQLDVFYNKDETMSERAKNPKFADAEVYDFSEEVLKDGKTVQVNVYRHEFELPTYETARKWILEAIKEPPKPILVVPLQ